MTPTMRAPCLKPGSGIHSGFVWLFYASLGCFQGTCAGNQFSPTMTLDAFLQKESF